MEGQKIVYGNDHKDQFMYVYKPQTHRSVIVCLLHGGFYKKEYGLDLMLPLVKYLYDEGFAVANIEYPRYSPGKKSDPLLTVKSVFKSVSKAGVGYDKVILIGHSAGGHLALLSNNADKVLKNLKRKVFFKIRIPNLVISLAGITDLKLGAEEGLSDKHDAIQNWIGGNPDDPLYEDLYKYLSPTTYGFFPRNHVKGKFLFVHGGNDKDVPEKYSMLVGPSPVMGISDSNHFDVINPEHEIWKMTYNEMLKYLI